MSDDVSERPALPSYDAMLPCGITMLEFNELKARAYARRADEEEERRRLANRRPLEGLDDDDFFINLADRHRNTRRVANGGNEALTEQIPNDFDKNAVKNDARVREILETTRFNIRLRTMIVKKAAALTRYMDGVLDSEKLDPRSTGYAIHLTIGNGKDFDVSFQHSFDGLDPRRVVLAMIQANTPVGFVPFHDIKSQRPFEVVVAYVPDVDDDDEKKKKTKTVDLVFDEMPTANIGLPMKVDAVKKVDDVD